ncbi:hypothetical protein F2Q70_00027448 [Brassica cretica]|uniref:RNase H type-1 domain-containing protein n=1 Tax=Brassica cretica TaxID=69181 RepID=A0A8S9LJ21_BRACR|nr:hypothetical protein F2Q70_00027448 [Brassica cretica]
MLPPFGVLGNTFPWLCWTIWIARNHLLFENRHASATSTAPKAILAQKEWKSVQPNRPRSSPKVILPPPQVLSNSPHMVFSWIFTDHNATELARGSCYQRHVSSPCMGEALAIQEALLQAASLNHSHICIRTDSQVLVRAITSRRCTTDLFRVLADIDDLTFSTSSPFSSCLFVFIPRDCNTPADGLTKACLSSLILAQNST